MNNEFKFGVVVCVCIVIVFWLDAAYKAKERVHRVKFEQEAVQKGHAIYNPTNGIFQWKELN